MSDGTDRPTSGRVHLGALSLDLDADEPTWADTLALRFRSRLHPCDDREPDVVLRVVALEEKVAPAIDLNGALQVDRHGSHLRYDSGIMSMDADTATSPVEATLRVRGRGQWIPHLHHFFAVHLDALLLALGALRLHAAAVELDGTTHVFVGDKGAGKSTISLALGLAGGRVLAEDHILLRRSPSGLTVSGFDGNVRLTEKTESHFLASPLRATPADHGGVWKKEVPLADLVESVPHTEFTPRTLFFPRVGTGFATSGIAPRAAVARTMRDATRTHRFADTHDRVALLSLVADFVGAVEPANLELSPDLTELDRLVDLLRS